MATFVVEDGTGLSTATSLVDVAFADAYIADYFPASDWDTFTTADKEFRLVEASAFLSLLLRWESSITADTQALSWPRKSFRDNEERLIVGDAVPERIQQAVVRVAQEAITGDINSRPVYLTSQDYGDSRESYSGPTKEGGNEAIFRLKLELARAGYGSSTGSITNVFRA